MLRILDWKIETSVSIEFLPHKKGKFPYVNESLDSQRPFMVSRFFFFVFYVCECLVFVHIIKKIPLNCRANQKAGSNNIARDP